MRKLARGNWRIRAAGQLKRHSLLTKHERLQRLEKATAERKLELSDEQVRLLERFSQEFRERYIEALHTGSLVAVDTFFVGTLNGVGTVYLQTVIDCTAAMPGRGCIRTSCR